MSTEILEKVHDFCVSHDIKYSLGYGSLIGAIRHKGFIPWDDDIDIFMPRPDYDRFLATFIEPGLGVMSSYDPESYILFSHVYDLSRTFVRTRFPFSKRCLGGVWIHAIYKKRSWDWLCERFGERTEMGFKPLIARWNKSCIPWGTTNHWSQMSVKDYGEKMYQLMEDFEECVPVSFEGKQFLAIKGYYRSLRKISGDYMELPPEEDRRPHTNDVVASFIG